MLLHHDSRSYETAASDAADWARNKLQRLIEEGRPKAASVIDIIQREQPVDHLVRSNALTFKPNDAGRGIDVAFGNVEQPLHLHALKQAASRAGLPLTYVNRLLDEENAGWGSELLAQNLRRLYAEQFGGGQARFLLRSTQGEVRGVLSDRYRRLDSRPIVDAFAKACGAVGAVPVDGFVSATKMGLRAMLPEVYEPVPNEVMCVGISLENSDYGNGALALRLSCTRLICTNTLIASDGLRAVHIGARLSDDFSWSNRTHRLDTKRMASAVDDVVKSQLSSARVDDIQDAIRQANEERVSPAQVGAFLKKSLSKADAEKVTEAFRSADVENMPPGNTRWRLSNALSWVAGQTEEPEAKLDLMKLAGKALPQMGED